MNNHNNQCGLGGLLATQLPSSTLLSQTRFYFIELLAQWEGRVNAGQVAQQFTLSRQQAQACIKEYQAFAPHNLQYHRSVKAQVPTVQFNPLLVSDDVHDYLHWLKTGHFQPSAATTVESLTLPARQVSAHVMRALTAAVKQQQRLEVDYVSLSSPNRQGRIIAPHSFVNTGLRWHLRAFCEKSHEYRDFVLSRFRGQPDLLGKTENTQQHDVAWNTQVTVKLQVDKRLSDDKRQVLEQDYQMRNGELTMTTRGCMVNYLLRELQINTKMLEVTPEAQQLVCVNLSELRPWLFDA